MSDITLNIHLTGPTWAWYVLGAALAIAALSWAIKTGVDAWATHIRTKLGRS